MIPLLIIIPFWHGDSARVTTLAKVMANLEPENCEKECWVLLAARQDTAPNGEAAKILAKKFRVIEFRCNSPLRGYPSGANGIFSSSMMHVNQSYAGKVEAVFWMEADATPMRPDWRVALINSWRTRKPGVHVMGHLFDPSGTGAEWHINGGALYAPNMVKIFPKITMCDRTAWDWGYKREIVAMGQHTDEIRYIHKVTNMRREDFGPRFPAVVHGVKDDSLVQSVAAHYKFEL